MTDELQFWLNKRWVCAWQTFGMAMGDEFLDTLDEPPAYKEAVTNECRTAHGQAVALMPEVRLKHREMTLTLVMCADTAAELRDAKAKFFDILSDHNGLLWLRVPALSEAVYRLRYTGKGTEYGYSLDRRTCRMALKFVEDNPADRSLP